MTIKNKMIIRTALFVCAVICFVAAMIGIHTAAVQYLILLLISFCIFTFLFCIGMKDSKIRFDKLGEFLKGESELKSKTNDGNGRIIYDCTENELFEDLKEISVSSYESKYLQTEARLHALQNQINPHFLYNTLELIRSKAIAGGVEDVADMVETMAILFRYSINAPGEMATLSQELANIHNYMLIQHARFGNRFQYQETIDVADDQENIMNCTMPVMTLQPLIENALMHGIIPKINGGTVSFHACIDGEDLCITVSDDGIGMDDETLLKVRKSIRSNRETGEREEKGKRDIGIALHNVNQRIQFYYGERYGLEIFSTANVGTSMIIRIPYRKG